MFGKIIFIDHNYIKVENISNKVDIGLIGIHVVFEGKKTIVGEILNIDKSIVEILLVGEIKSNKFIIGISSKPDNNSNIRIIKGEEVSLLLGNQNVSDRNSIYLGKSLTYEGFNVSANINNLFSNHFAIIGNTGSGKSSTIARMFQNLFYRKENIPINSHFVLFDVYGEYFPALNMINQTICKCKFITTDNRNIINDIIKIPPWFLGVDEIALLLNVTSPSQIPLIEKTLKIVYLFTEEEEKVIKYKNNIISKALLDILTSGRTPVQIRDQIIAVLTSFYTNDINLESKIIQPGYIRTIRQCLNIDESGKINTINLVIEFLKKFINDEYTLNDNMKPKFYNLKDLYNAFEFALLSEGILKSDKVYDQNNILKVRLDFIMNSDLAKYFDVKEYISVSDYVHNLFLNEKGEKVQIINFNLNYVDERFAKVVTKIYSKLLFDYSISLENRGSFPVQIMLEEAHRYVQNDNDIAILGYNIFDRITKEGRKYGVVLGLITQRPAELSETALSQCSNYIILKIVHPEDLRIVKNISYCIDDKIIERLKTIPPGVALCFGNSFNIPTFVKIDKPNPSPYSQNANIEDSWFK